MACHGAEGRSGFLGAGVRRTRGGGLVYGAESASEGCMGVDQACASAHVAGLARMGGWSATPDVCVCVESWTGGVCTCATRGEVWAA
jgi:hypothetical protein